jgi:capsular exopolysaccharide synthesis family protein
MGSPLDTMHKTPDDRDPTPGALTPAQPQSAPPPSTDVREPVPDFDEDPDLRDYLDVLLRRKWLVATVLLAVFTTTLIVTLAMTPVYKASGRLEFNLQPAKVTKFEEVVATQLQTREFMNTQMKLLTSASLAQRVIDALNLAENPAFNEDLETAGGASPSEGILASLRTRLKELLGRGTPAGQGADAFDEAEKRQRLLETFADNLEVQAERDTTIMNIAFSSPDPALARDVVNALIRTFIDWQMDKKIDAAGLANEQLQKQIEVARIRLEKSETELNRFAQKAGIVSLDSRLNLVYKQLEEINGALAKAQAERLTKEALYRQAAEGEVAALPMVITNELIQRLQQDRIQLVAQYEDLLTVFKEDYPAAKRLKAKIDDMTQKIQAEEQRIFRAIENDYRAALKTEEALRKRAEEAKTRALELNDKATQYKILEREVATNKEIHQALLQRAREIDATVGADISNIQVVDHAILPVKPDKPKLRLNLLLALVVGLMLGVGAAFFLEYLDNTVKNLDEISDRFGIPILGVLPEVDEKQQDGLDRVVTTNPRAGFAEAIRTTRVSIQLSTAADGGTRSLLVTSTNKGEGKSTIAANMAQAFAAAGDRVLLLDADLRRPRLHRIFSQNGDRAGGLSELLTGTKRLDDVLRKTDVPNLYFIPAGPLPPNPAELLASKRMRTFMEKCARAFDRIIVDGPPSVGFADVLVLSSMVNGVILVSTMGRTHRQALRLFKRSLANIRARLLGTIVNRLDVQKRYGGYYYKYYKYYSYYYHPYAYGDGDDVPKLEEGEARSDRGHADAS